MEIRVQSNPVFREVHNSKARYVIMKGSAGSGKSVDTAQQYILRLLGQKGRNLLCIRRSENSNRYSTFAELVGAINRLQLQSYFRISTAWMSIKCVNGNEVIFRGVHNEKEREKLKSITFKEGKLTDVWIEEMTEISQADFEIIDDRLRGTLPSGLFYQVKGTFNPVSVHHWIKRAFFDHRDKHTLTHHSSYLDNRFIDRAYFDRMERRRQVDPEGYRIYGLGEWGELSGLVLTNWEEQEISQDVNDYDSVAIGQDFGFNHANALLLVGMKDDNLHVLREIYVHEKDTEEIIAIADAASFPKDIEMYCDSAEPDRIKTWRRAGYRALAVKKSGTRPVKAQIDWLKQREIRIHPSCLNTLREIQQWRWKKDAATGAYYDEPLEVLDDAMAALRYAPDKWRNPRQPISIIPGGL